MALRRVKFFSPVRARIQDNVREESPLKLTLQFRQFRLAQAVSILCVFLVLMISGVQATHVHPDSAKHDCSLCMVAHAGALVTADFDVTPQWLPARMESAREPRLLSRLLSSFLYIRPPPSV